MLSRNLKYLRKKAGRSQEEMSQILGLSRTTLAGYENGHSEMSVSFLKKISEHFGVSADELLSTDLDSPLFRNPPRAPNLKNESTRILVATLDRKKRENIAFLPVSAIAGYSIGYNDPVFFEEKSGFELPKLLPGTYRAFEIQGDSMLPIKSGSVVVGQFVESWKNLQNGRRYVLALKNEGVVFKRVVNEVFKNKNLILASDNPDYQPFTVALEDVLEAWELVAYIVYGDETDSESGVIVQKLHMLEQKINQLLIPSK